MVDLPLDDSHDLRTEHDCDDPEACDCEDRADHAREFAEDDRAQYLIDTRDE